MQVQELIRAFKYNSVTLNDPNPAFSLAQVRDFYAGVYPELLSAEIEGPETSGNKQTYTFRRAVGTKGNRSGIFYHCTGAVDFLPPDVGNRRFFVLDPTKPIDPVDYTKLPDANKGFSRIVADLYALAKIGWFEGKELELIQRLHEQAQSPEIHTLAFPDMLYALRLHMTHCSREVAA